MITEIEAPKGRGRGRKRTREPGAESVSRGPPKKRGPKPGLKAARAAGVQYCSQIAPAANGIKLKIKKFNSVPQKPVKMPKELTKRKKKKYKTSTLMRLNFLAIVTFLFLQSGNILTVMTSRSLR